MNNREFDRCMRRMQKGDKTGLKEIYEAYISYIYAVIRAVVKNKENAEDLTAEFFIKLWNMADQYKAGSGHKTWMTVIARNMAIDFMRKAGREQLTEEVPEASAADAASETAGSMENDVVGRMNFRETVEKLPETERQIMTMKLAGQMTFKEISAVLGIPMGTVTWKYQNSLEKLRRVGVWQRKKLKKLTRK